MSIEARHSSVSNEHYTPPLIAEPGRRCSGGLFDLDPASCALANTVIQADDFYTKKDNGLILQWYGRVFVNPPGGLLDEDFRPVYVATKKRKSCRETGDCGLPPGPDHKHRGVTSSAKAWWQKAAHEWARGHCESVVFLAFTVELLQSAQVVDGGDYILPTHAPYCLPKHRVPFLAEKDGKLVPQENNTHASCVVFLPNRSRLYESITDFCEAFAPIGSLCQALRAAGPHETLMLGEL